MAHADRRLSVDDGERGGRSLRRRIRLGCLILPVAILPVALSATVYISCRVHAAKADRALDAEIERLRAAGVIAPIEDLIPRVPLGERNAADVYREAFAAFQPLSEAEEEVLGNDPWDAPVRLTVLIPAVERNERHFALLDEAAALPSCAFPVDWSIGIEVLPLKHHDDLRRASTWQRRRSQALLAHRDPDAALRCVAPMFQLAEHVKREPTIESQDTAYALQISAIWAVSAVLSAADPSPAACRELSTLLAAIDNTGSLIAAARGNTAIFDLPLLLVAREHGYASPQFAKSLAAFMPHRWLSEFGYSAHSFDIAWVEWADRGAASWPERIFTGGLMRAARPFIPDDIAHYLSYREKLIHAHSLPWPESHAAQSAAITELLNAADLESMLAWFLVRPMNDLSIARDRDTAAALVAAARVALAAAVYRAEHSRYPPDMDDLEGEGWELPPAVVAGAALEYRLHPDGFSIRCVRPGAQHGHLINLDLLLEGNEELVDGAFDIEFRATRAGGG
jgi:hypothetical protein